MRGFIFELGLTALVLLSCAKENAGLLDLYLDSGRLITKSADPSEDLISDLNIMVFNFEGELEESRYISRSELRYKNGLPFCSLRLGAGIGYSVYACANIGFEIKGIRNLEELGAYRYYLAYPDDYKAGIPMSGKLDIEEQSSEAVLKLQRLMSKVSVSVDKSALDSGISFKVNSLIVGNCPRYVSPFRESSIQQKSDSFITGFMKSDHQLNSLNAEGGGEISLYLLESIASEDAPFIEMRAEYDSEYYHTAFEKYLIYRFFIGDEEGVRRNCHYHYSITPQGDALACDDDWMLDKGALVEWTR